MSIREELKVATAEFKLLSQQRSSRLVQSIGSSGIVTRLAKPLIEKDYGASVFERVSTGVAGTSSDALLTPTSAGRRRRS